MRFVVHCSNANGVLVGIHGHTQLRDMKKRIITLILAILALAFTPSLRAAVDPTNETKAQVVATTNSTFRDAADASVEPAGKSPAPKSLAGKMMAHLAAGSKFLLATIAFLLVIGFWIACLGLLVMGFRKMVRGIRDCWNANPGDTQFLADCQKILKSRQLPADCPSLLELINAIGFEQHSVQKKVPWFKWLGFFLLGAIPLLSALMSTAVASGDKIGWPGLERMTLIASLILTVMTIVNSTFKPAERFKELCGIGIGIQKFKSDLLLSLESLPIGNEDKLHEHIGKMRGDFSRYSTTLSTLFMPQNIEGQ